MIDATEEPRRAPFRTREQLRAAAALHPTAWAMYASGWGEGQTESGSPSPGDWENGAHFDLLADHVLDMRDLKLQRLCVSLPPGHGKTDYLGVYVASWWLGTRPHDRVVIASYGKDLARDPCKKGRDLLAKHGLEVFGVGASTRDQQTWWYPRDADLQTIGPGFCYAVGRGGALTGKRAELLIVDDLFKDDEEAGSAATREKAWRWLESVALTRLLPWSCVIVIGTRWHRDDHIGRLEDAQREGRCVGGRPWKFVNLPALADEDDPLGRAPGEALWPRQFSREFLEAYRAGCTPRLWACLHQGRPVAEGGSLFKEAWENLYTLRAGMLSCGDLAVPLGRLVRFAVCDFAGSKSQRADYTCVTVFGIDHETRTLWLLHVLRERLDAPEIMGALRQVYQEWKPAAFYAEDTSPQLNRLHALALAEAAGELVDPAADLRSNTLLLALTDGGLPMRRVAPVTDKVTRSTKAQTVAAAGRLYLPKTAPWLPVWQDEIYSFPDVAHDDQADCLSYGAIVFYDVLLAQALADGRAAQEAARTLPIAGDLGLV